MFGCDAYFKDGTIFALIWKEGRIGVKLPDDASYAELAKVKGAEQWSPGGKMVMGSWLLVPATWNENEDKLRPWAEKTKGLVRRLASADGPLDLPTVLPVRGSIRSADDQRLSIRMTDETVLKGINSLPLFTGLLGLAALLFLISATWYREGR